MVRKFASIKSRYCFAIVALSCVLTCTVLAEDESVEERMATKAASKASRSADYAEILTFDNRPHLFLRPIASFNTGGFQKVSPSISGGIEFEMKRFMFRGLAGYNAARKVNDGTVNNRHGHVRSLNGSVFYRLPNYWFFGTEVGWGKLDTTNYSKQSWSPAFGGGKDFLARDISMRLKVVYTLPYTDHHNGSQGPAIEFTMPSPLSQSHFYFYERVGISIFHATITDPHNKQLTEQEIHARSFGTSMLLGFIIRY